MTSISRILILTLSFIFPISLANAQDDDINIIEETRSLTMKNLHGICEKYAPRLENISSYDTAIGILWICLEAKDRGAIEVQNGIALSLLNVIQRDEYNNEFDIDFDRFLAASIIYDLILGSTVMLDTFADYENIESVLANGALLTNRPDGEDYCTHALRPCIFDITTGENFVSSRRNIGREWNADRVKIHFRLRDMINGRR